MITKKSQYNTPKDPLGLKVIRDHSNSRDKGVGWGRPNDYVIR